ncbi:hypothetical protein BT69DRAFT_1337851 [Atractiella rhizophila]|nr:hypothetical protein BT69DRAFT_1337851 [Atractiella rhizophila]
MDDLNGIAGLLHTIWELIKDSRWEIAEEGGRIIKAILDTIEEENADAMMMAP